MELQQMRYVVAIAETNSFTRAAERCLVAQSALSHQVARLERELGARLFERTSRRVRLTAAGAAFLPEARRCLEAAERAVSEVAAAVGEVRGPLEVGLIPTVAAVDVPRALRDFRRRYPQVRIGLRVGASDDLVEQVKEGEIEVAFLGLPTTARPQGVNVRELGRDRHVAVVAPDHPLAAEESVSLERLVDEVFVDMPAGTAGRIQSDQAFEAAGLDRDVAFEVSSAEYMARLVGEGLGVALLPAAYVPQLTGVTTLDVTDATGRVEYVVWARTGTTPAARAFLDIIGGPGAPGTASIPGAPDIPDAPGTDGTAGTGSAADTPGTGGVLGMGGTTAS